MQRPHKMHLLRKTTVLRPPLRAFWPAAALVVLTACGGGDSEGPDQPAMQTGADPPAQTARPATPEPAGSGLSGPDAREPAETGAIADADIPSALRGRWGLVAADCEPGRPDAKGLLTIDARSLEFYESVGTLDKIEDFAPMRIRAIFDFTGEGMEWEREMVIQAQDGGNALVRREYGADAAPEPLRYGKCR